MQTVRMEESNHQTATVPSSTAPVRGARLPLANGGHVIFDEYGDPHGRPVIFCHGWPSSRTMARLTDAAAWECGLRIISPDRPGIRGSSFQAGRVLRDWPEVVRSLAAHLSIERFHLLAVSGGAPYAYATAVALPERVAGLAIVSGVPPLAEIGDYSGLLPIHRRLLTLHARQPKFLRALFHLARPVLRLRAPLRVRPMLLRFLQPCDAAVLRERAAFEACFESARQAWSGSAQGVITDAEIYARPWGFEPEAITHPVRMWHGIKDRTFAVRLAEQWSGRLPNCRLKLVEDAGHYSLPIRHMPEILRDLASL
ncbi:MAG: alpha/beta hydrolase [Chthoniobacterales bacterium]